MKNFPVLLSQRDAFVDSFDKVFDKLMQTHFPSLQQEFGVDFISKSSYPRVNVTDYADRLVITAEVAGLSKEDVDITFKDGILTIAGHKREENKQDGTVIWKELKHSSFKRAFQLADHLVGQKASAKFNNGILDISIPKSEPKTEVSTKINID
jgi:HSP20 family protein